MSVAIEPVGGPAPRRVGRVALGVVVPLGVTALACLLWWIGDRLMYVGPLDRAAFGWAIVIPLWISAPLAAGFVWRPLSACDRVVAAALVGAAICGGASLLLWQAVASPSCEFGATRTPVDHVLPSLFVGGVIGASLSVSGLLVAAVLGSGHPWRAVILGAAVELTLVFAAILAATAVLHGPACQRPPV